MKKKVLKFVCLLVFSFLFIGNVNASFDYNSCIQKCSSHSYESCKKDCCSKEAAECYKQKGGDAQSSCLSTSRINHNCTATTSDNATTSDSEYEKKDLGSDALFMCKYDSLKIGSEGSSDTFPLEITVFKDDKLEFNNAGHDADNVKNDDGEITGEFKSVYANSDQVVSGNVGMLYIRSFNYKNFNQNGYQCPDLYTYYDWRANTWNISDEGKTYETPFYKNDSVKPILNSSNSEGPSNVLKVTKECNNYVYKRGTIKGLSFDVEMRLQKYNNGDKEMCLKLRDTTEVCKKSSGDENVVTFEHDNVEWYYFDFELSKVFTEETKDSFKCSKIYLVQKEKTRYFFTSDENDLKLYEYVPGGKEYDVEPEEQDNKKVVCGVLTEKTQKFIYNILDWIKYIALVLAIGLSVLDFFKAVASEEDDAFTKAGKRLAKRIAVVVALFLLPVILEFVLKLVHIQGVDTSNPMCK